MGPSASTNASDHASELASGNLVGYDDETWRHYEICFWETVDPIFPVIHYSTYVAGAPHECLRNVVCALGAQASPRAAAKKHSIALFDGATTQCQPLEPLDALRTPVEFLQFTLLVEYLALYRSRSVGVHRSEAFSSLFNTVSTTEL